MTANRGVLAVITNDPTRVFQRDVISGLNEVALGRGYRTQIVQVATRPATLESLGLDAGRVRGALVIATALPDPLLGALAETGIALSLISHQVPGLDIPAIMPNNRQGIALLVEHMVRACGRTRPVFIRGDMDQNDGRQRDMAFGQEMLRYHLSAPPEHRLRGDFEPDIAAQSLRAFLAQGIAFDAVIASDYLMAVAAVTVLREAGIAVPDQVAVAGFGDGPEAAAAGLTTVAADVVELGRRGGRQLIGQVEGLRVRGLTLLSTELIIRATTAPAR